MKKLTAKNQKAKDIASIEALAEARADIAARQGMVLVVPTGDTEDHTRSPQFYDGTFNYLKEIGFAEI